jgi:hypothetical protein
VPLSRDRRRRKNGQNSVRNRAWYRELRQRIAERKEYCRRCGVVVRNLHIAHLKANIRGGHYGRTNLTILCPLCDLKAHATTITDLPSLADEARLTDPRRSRTQRDNDLALLPQLSARIKAAEQIMRKSGQGSTDWNNAQRTRTRLMAERADVLERLDRDP